LLARNVRACCADGLRLRTQKARGHDVPPDVLPQRAHPRDCKKKGPRFRGGPWSRTACPRRLLAVERQRRVPRTSAAGPADRGIAPLTLQDVAVAVQRDVATVCRECAVLVSALVGDLAALRVGPCVQLRIRHRLELL